MRQPTRHPTDSPRWFFALSAIVLTLGAGVLSIVLTAILQTD